MFLLQRHVEQSVSVRRLLPPKRRLVVGVSGGVDSVVLLHILAGLSRERGWKLIVAHLNHQLRGNSSLADERLVRRTARALQLPIVVSRADVRKYARRRKLSLEVAARTLRHDFLARTAALKRASHVILAHHLDDQVELFFLRLFRGAGSQGLAGMKWSGPSPSNCAVTLVRPLLDCSKNDLLAYASEHEIAFRNDASNQNLAIQRNRVRHDLLPVLERKYQASLRTNVGHLMDIVGAEAEVIDEIALSWLASNSPNPAVKLKNSSSHALPGNNWFSGAALNRLPFHRLPAAIQRRCIQLQLIGRGIQLNFHLVEHLRLNPEVPIQASRPATHSRDGFKNAHPPGGPLVLARDHSGHLRPVARDSFSFRTCTCELNLTESDTASEWGGVRLKWQIRRREGAERPMPRPRTELFDADAVGEVVQLRHWRPGDRFQPIGMEHAVKLQDLFVNQKVAPDQRRQLLVATTSRGDIFWVEGLRISEQFKLTKNTIRRLLWHWQRL